MRKTNIFYVALAAMTLATSCSQDELQSSQAAKSEINFNASIGLKSRAEETNTTNLQSSCFYVSSFVSEKENYMKDVKYTYANQKWSSPTGETYFWPVSETLNFYAYAYGHQATQTTLSGVTINKTDQKIEDFSPATGSESEGSKADASKQEDLIYAAVTGNKTSNGENGITLTFKHALSEISVKALNSNTAYKVEVKGVKLGNIINKNTFTFPTATSSATSDGTWGEEASETGSYETDYTSNVVTLKSEAQNVDANAPFMLIPQQCTKGTDNDKSKYSAGHYIALNVTITMKSGDSEYNGATYTGWAYVGIDTKWEQGKHYTYTLDFTAGAGQDSEGNPIISGKEIAVAVDVTEWNNSEKYIVNPDISTTPTEANCLIMNSPGKVYAINIASKPNAFWTSAAAGTDQMDSDPITDDTEWTAEVIWQDITNYEWETGGTPSKPDGYTQKRAIDFYDLTDGAKTSDDTYSGKGKTLYIQLKNAYRGNIVVGVKKKDAQDSDGYLWSWHLWLTEDPLCIGGFMDRNLGATGGLMTTASHPGDTFGTFYQFGRKDPLARDIHYFDINGDLITKWEETKDESGNKVRPYVLTGPKSFAEVVKNPLQLCATTSGEWTTDTKYVGNLWYDINNTTSGKTIFDPSPDGWRLPTESELSTVINSGAIGSFIWKESTLKGWVYNGNWFAASGYLHCKAEADATYNNEQASGFVWSSNPNTTDTSHNLAYGIYFNVSDNNSGKDANASTNRGDAASVRCVPE